MRTATLSTLITNIERAISQVPGSGTQIYAEPVIERKIQEQFDIVFTEAWWYQFRGAVSVTTTVGTGLPTTNFSSSPVVRGLEDIRYIFGANRTRPLPILPATVNPDEVTGTTARFFDPVVDSTKLFRILPLNSVTVLNVIYRSMPGLFTTADVVNFDQIYLENAVAWDIVNGDGNNPGEAEKFQTKAELRLSQLKRQLTSHPIPVAPNASDQIPDEWFIGSHI